jgi:DNA-binding response OmpR family regulator
MISGRIEIESVVEIFKHGALDVVGKPFHPAGLVQRSREALDSWGRRRR